MNRILITGIILTVAGLSGYLLGIRTPFPGRAFTVVAVMIGITLVSIGQWGDTGGSNT